MLELLIINLSKEFQNLSQMAKKLMQKFLNITNHTHLLLGRKIERARAAVSDLASRRSLTDPEGLLAERRMLLTYLSDKIGAQTENMLILLRSRFTENASKLEAMSPLAILGRGYAVATDADGNALRSIDGVRVGDPVNIRLHDGLVAARVDATRPLDEK